MNRLLRFMHYILSAAIFLQTFTPAYATPISSMEQVERDLALLREHKSLPSALTFKAVKNKTAAGVLHYALRNGEIHIFLGERVDGGLCNFGGVSDEENKSQDGQEYPNTPASLAITAYREVKEESNKLLCTHHRLLAAKPFIDVVSQKNEGLQLYRMYWEQIEYLDAAIFQKALEHAELGHCREFKSFKWYSVNDVYRACLNNNPNLSPEETIFGPLFATLCTDSGKNFLEQLQFLKGLKRFSPATREFKNRMYLIEENNSGVKEKPLEVRAQWQVDVDNLDSRLPEAKKARKAIFHELITQQKPVALGFDAAGRQVTDTCTSTNQFAGAVAAHGAAILEMKTRFERQAPQPELIPYVKPVGPINPEDPKLWDPMLGETITRIHLRMVLGPDFRQAKDFARNQRQADIANLREYFRRFTDVAYAQKYAMKEEFKRQIYVLESDYEVLAHMMDLEEQQLWPSFYHAANAEQNNLWTSFTSLRRQLMLNPLPNIVCLRGTDIYFHAHNDMRAVLQDIGHHDYTAGRGSQVLSANFPMTAGRNTTRSSSNSNEYLVNNHSVDEQDMDARYEEAMALAGFETSDYSPFHSLFQQYLAYAGGDMANSVMVSIAVNPDKLNKYSYAAHGGGTTYLMSTETGLAIEKPADRSEEPDNSTSSALFVLHRIQEEYRRLMRLPKAELFEEDNARKLDLFPEMRLHLHPDLVLNPQHIRFNIRSRFNIPADKQMLFNNKMRATTASVLADWLAQETAVLPGSFMAYPQIKLLYKMIHRGVTGYECQERTSKQGFMFLVRHANVEGTAMFLDMFPQIKADYVTDESKRSLIYTSLLSGTEAITDVLMEKVVRAKFEELFPLGGNHFFVLQHVLTGIKEKSGEMVDYVLKQFDAIQITPALKKRIYEIHRECIWSEESLGYWYNFIPEMKPDLLSLCLVRPNLLYRLTGKVFKPQEILEALVILRQTDTATSAGWSNLDGIDVDIWAEHPETGEAVVFGLFEDENLVKYLDKYIPNLSDDDKQRMSRITNKQGMNLLQAFQKLFLEKRLDGPNCSLLFQFLNPLVTRDMAQFVTEINSSFYTPYGDFFGRPTLALPFIQPLMEDNFNGIQPLVYPVNLQWAQSLQNICTLPEYFNCILNCPSSAVWHLMRHKIESLHPVTLLTEQKVRLGEIWKKNVQAVIDIEDYTLAQAMVDEHPDLAAECDFSRELDSEEPGEISMEKIDRILFFSHLTCLKYRVILDEMKDRRFSLTKPLKAISQWVKGLFSRPSIALPEGPMKPSSVQIWCEELNRIMPNASYSDYTDHLAKMPLFDTATVAAELEKKFPRESLAADLEDFWIQSTLVLLTEHAIDLAYFKARFAEAPCPGAQQNLLSYLLFPQLDNDGYDKRSPFAEYLPYYLEQVFPDRQFYSTLGKMKLKIRDSLKYDYNMEADEDITSCLNLSYFIPLHPELLRHAGPFAGNMIPDAIWVSDHFSEATLAELVQLSPDFLQKSNGIDSDNFLDAITYWPFALRKTICLQHLDKLKEIAKPYALPYVFYLFQFKDAETLNLIKDIYEKDPSILMAKTSDGLTVVDLIHMEFIAPQIKKWLHKNIVK